LAASVTANRGLASQFAHHGSNCEAKRGGEITADVAQNWHRRHLRFAICGMCGIDFEGNGSGVNRPRCNRRVCHVDGVLGIGKLIKHGLRTDDEKAPEFLMDANLGPAQKRSVRCGAKCAAERVCCAASVIPTSAEIAADIEAGLIIGIGAERSGCKKRVRAAET
jgi:hypothetical protein